MSGVVLVESATCRIGRHIRCSRLPAVARGRPAREEGFQELSDFSALVSASSRTRKQERRRLQSTGFTSAPVFRLGDTEGDPLPPPDPKVMTWLESLPFA